MNIFLFLMTIFSQFNLSSGDAPARLDKREDTSKLDKACNKACPYVLVIALAILTVLIMVILVKYGHAITGTEANNYYYHSGV